MASKAAAGGVSLIRMQAAVMGKAPISTRLVRAPLDDSAIARYPATSTPMIRKSKV